MGTLCGTRPARGDAAEFSRRRPLGIKQERNGIELLQPVNIKWYIWRPIMSEPQLCTLKELRDGTYNINDLADMHEALDVIQENMRRLNNGK